MGGGGSWRGTGYDVVAPHGQWLVIPDRNSAQEPYALFLVSVETGEKRKLTSPPKDLLGDVDPAVSPDGRAVAFSQGDRRGGRSIFICWNCPRISGRWGNQSASRSGKDGRMSRRGGPTETRSCLHQVLPSAIKPCGRWPFAEPRDDQENRSGCHSAGKALCSCRRFPGRAAWLTCSAAVVRTSGAWNWVEATGWTGCP